jgi:hypothetical protein
MSKLSKYGLIAGGAVGGILLLVFLCYCGRPMLAFFSSCCGCCCCGRRNNSNNWAQRVAFPPKWKEPTESRVRRMAVEVRAVQQRLRVW